MKFIYLIIFFISGCNGSDEFISLSLDEIKYIYDGDTFYIYCQDDFKCKDNGTLGVRVKGVDTAEMKGKCKYEKELARKAKQFTVAQLRNGSSITLYYSPTRMYDRYGRLLARVIIDNNELGPLLVSKSLGRTYSGGKRMSWCE